MPFRILHIGAGNWSRFAHAPVLRQLASGDDPAIILAGICDLDLAKAEDFRVEFGYRKAYRSFAEALPEAAPDAIYCTVQPAATFAVVSALLPLRIPLFIEKPPGVSLAEANMLATLAAEYDTLTYVAFNRRRIPAIERMKIWASQNTVRYAQAEMLRVNRREPQFATETAIHALDTLRYLLGEPSQIDVHKQRYISSAAFDYQVRLQFSSGTVANLSILPDCGVRRESYSLHTEGGSYETTLGADYSNPCCAAGDRRYQRDELTELHDADWDPLTSGGSIGEHGAFLEAVKTGRAPDCTLRDAALSMQLAEALRDGVIR